MCFEITMNKCGKNIKTSIKIYDKINVDKLLLMLITFHTINNNVKNIMFYNMLSTLIKLWKTPKNLYLYRILYVENLFKVKFSTFSYLKVVPGMLYYYRNGGERLL